MVLVKSLGSIETLKANGITGPVSYHQKEVDALNQKRGNEGVRKISLTSPLLNLGYFPLKSIMDKLKKNPLGSQGLRGNRPRVRRGSPAGGCGFQVPSYLLLPWACLRNPPIDIGLNLGTTLAL